MRRLTASGLAIAIAAVSLVACVEPELAPDDADDGGAPETTVDVPPSDDELRLQVGVLVEQLTTLRATLDDVAAIDDVSDARAAGDIARVLLIDGDRGGEPPLLPNDAADRASTPDNPAVLLSVLAEARATSSAFAEDVEAVVADQIAGDLGAWQRDPQGMVQLASTTAASADNIAALETAILALAGEGTRTLAWVEVLRSAPDLATAHAAAERAATHVELILDALEELDANVVGSS
ncbi:MAG: hypothetical protein WD011_05010 [Nitriliruptoraceae bacterium]